MNLDELRSVQDRERQKDSLQHLRDSFYEEVGRYVADLKAERERKAEQADDPFASPEVRRLTDEIETAEEVAESIYERRMGKVVKNASLAAAGYATDSEGLTAEEEHLFGDLVERIEGNKETVLDVLSGTQPGDAGPDDRGAADAGAGTRETPEAGSDARPAGDTTPAAHDAESATEDARPSRQSTPVSPGERADAGTTSEAGDDDASDRPAAEAAAIAASETPADADRGSDPDVGPDTDDDPGGDGTSAASLMGGASGSTADAGDGSRSTPPTERPGTPTAAGGGGTGPDAGTTDRATLRITDDVGEIFGVDGNAYDLSADDVVALPEENATPLVEKNAARRIE